jgi:hypothetical protein
MAMKSILKTISLTLILLCCVYTGANAFQKSFAGKTQSSPYATIALLPGDSRSLDLEYDGLLWKTGVFNLALITAIIPDDEIHYLSIMFTPRGETGNDIGFFTFGGFIYTKERKVGFIQFLEPRLTYGSENVEYIINVYPAISTGVVFSAVIVEYFDFDYPFMLTLTATLSN